MHDVFVTERRARRALHHRLQNQQQHTIDFFFFNSVVVAHFPSLATVMFNCLPNRQLEKSKRALRPLHIFQFSNSNLAIAMQIITAHIHNYPTYAAYMFD